MKRAKDIITWTLGLLLAACGAPIEEGEPLQLGQNEQEIFMPSEYGQEANGDRCIPPWNGGICIVPDQKSIKWRFPTGHNCSPWSVTQTRSAMTQLSTFWGSDFTITETAAPNNNAVITCNTTETVAQNPRLETTQFFGGESHSTEHGQLKQYGTLQIVLYEGKIFDMPTFDCIGAACETRRRNFWGNVVRHSAGGHAMGLGHDAADNQGSHLMDKSFSGTDSTKAVYLGALGYSTSQLNGIDCYNQNSGTGDDCAN